MKNTHTLVLRRKYGEQGTNGTVTYQGRHICHTIELPDRNNIPRISCIPEGAISCRSGNTRGMANRSAFRMC